MINTMEKSKIVVTGSLAIDTLFYHNGVIQEGLSPGEFMGAAFNVRTVESFWGGCAGNIMYNAALLNTTASPFALIGIVGNDFADYENWLRTNKIATADVVTVADALTAHAYIMSDSKGKQMIVFYEGPGLFEHEARPKLIQKLTALLPQASLCHVAPNSHWFMTECMGQSRAHNVPYFFDPGQALGLFTKEELFEATSHAHGLFVNENEFERMQTTMGIELQSILTQETNLQFIVITKAEKGSEILLKNHDSITIPAASHTVVDPTGCGDAYRAAFLTVIAKALHHDKKPFSEIFKTRELFSLAGQSGSDIAGKCLSIKGTQRHTL